MMAEGRPRGRAECQVDEFTIHPFGTELPEHFDERLAKVVAEAGGRWVSFRCHFEPEEMCKKLGKLGYEARRRGMDIWVRPNEGVADTVADRGHVARQV